MPTFPQHYCLHRTGFILRQSPAYVLHVNTHLLPRELETYNKSNQAWSGKVNPKMWVWICIAHQLDDKEDHMGEGHSPTSLCHPATINFQKHLKIDCERIPVQRRYWQALLDKVKVVMLNTVEFSGTCWAEFMHQAKKTWGGNYHQARKTWGGNYQQKVRCENQSASSATYKETITSCRRKVGKPKNWSSIFPQSIQL